MDEELAENLLEAYRQVRHDYMNHLQVIMGYLQIGNVEKAREYSIKAANSIRRYDALLHVKPPFLQAVLTWHLSACGGESSVLELRAKEDFTAWREFDRELSCLVKSILTTIQDTSPENMLCCRISLEMLPRRQIGFCLEGSPDKLRAVISKLEDKMLPDGLFDVNYFYLSGDALLLSITKKEESPDNSEPGYR